MFLVLLFSTLCPSSFAVILMRKRELAAMLMSCDSQCSVALHHDGLVGGRPLRRALLSE